MFSHADSGSECELDYNIIDGPDAPSFSDREEGWADDEGDEVMLLNKEANQQASEHSGDFQTEVEKTQGDRATTNLRGSNYEGLTSMDVIGKQFASADDAESFFTEYARVMGFGVRRHNKRWNSKGMLIGRIWVCSRQGFRPKKFLDRDNRKREARPITRTGCQVEFRIAAKDERNGWLCTYFNGKHNHNLTPPHHVHFIRSHRKLTDVDIAAATSLNKVGVRPSQIHEYMVERSGGYKDVGYLRRDIQNRLDGHKRRELKESDAETCLSYLEGKKSVDPAFYYDFTVTEDNRLGDLFWCDGGGRADYAVFGDVIAFDATYRTNAYRKPFVVLLGINHHRRTIVFGFALLSDETEHTYTWLLGSFLSAMEGKQPMTVVTDGDKAMRNAISNKLLQAQHRLCCWHLARNAQTNVNKEFTSDFRLCMLRPYSKEKFEQKWRDMVLRHNVESHDWVTKMYRDKSMWAEAYLRGKFFGGMRSTQRSEGLNAYLNHYVSIKLRLIAFVKQMDRLIDRQRDVQGKDDFDSAEGQPVLITHMKPYETAAAAIYTRAMFRLVRAQILEEGMLIVVQVTNEDSSKLFRVKKWQVSDAEWEVRIHGSWDVVRCTCLMMETVGIPCSHLFAVMKIENMQAIPHGMILPRWTKQTKVSVSPEVEGTLRQQYMSVDARIGSLHAACRTLQKVAGQNIEAYNLAITEIYQLSLQLEAMSCQTAKETPKTDLGARFHVQDLVVVLTKGCSKKQKMGPPQQRKCSQCGKAGHTVRRCKTKVQARGEDTDFPTHSSNFIGENSVLLRKRPSAITNRGEQHTTTDEYDQQLTQQSNNMDATTSDSWYQHGMSTDNDSMDDTMVHALIPEYIMCSGSASTHPSNYAAVWSSNRI